MWIADRVDATGVLHNVPWCVLPCLLASADPEAFRIAVRVRTVVTRVNAGRWPSPPDEVAVLRQWVVRHPEPGYRLLGERALAGDARVILALTGQKRRGRNPVVSPSAVPSG
jgi:hypothetical protein